MHAVNQCRALCTLVLLIENYFLVLRSERDHKALTVQKVPWTRMLIFILLGGTSVTMPGLLTVHQKRSNPMYITDSNTLSLCYRDLQCALNRDYRSVDDCDLHILLLYIMHATAR